MIVFLTSGLWHGAAYNFVIWGGYHAVIQIVERIFHKQTDTRGMRRFCDMCFTFILAAYGWMMFYAPDMHFVADVTKGYLHLGMPYIHQTTIFFFAIGFAILLAKDLKDEFWPEKHFFLESKHIWVRYLSFAALSAVIVLCGVLGGGQFIYFKF